MKKKNIVIIIIVLILIFLIGIAYVLFNKHDVNNEYDFTNKIFHASGYVENTDYNQTYIFMGDGTYFNFISEYDEECTLRVVKGTWIKNKNIININYEKAIFYDGGELIETNDMAYFGKKRVNYKLLKQKFDGVISLEYKEMTGGKDDKYKKYLLINNEIYYPLYEFSTEEELSKKLEEMYGEIYTMLVDDSIEAIDNNTENNEDIKEDYTTEEE